MDNIYADPNMENDNTEHIRRKRLSSILKAPRNPLDDLGNGNELTQDINIEKRKKNSRRVSFANTINCRVFQRDVKNNTSESTEYEADTGNDVQLNQTEEPEAVPCEITGMDTLLHAPIQALAQHTEWHDVDNGIQRTNRFDTTLIFSDENEMDMTASHTAVIARNQRNSHADETEKIDITSFLAGLNSNNEKAETSKEFKFFSDPSDRPCPSLEQKEDATAARKINFNEFLMSLNSNKKAPSPTEQPEQENVGFVPSQVSEDVARSAVEFVYSREPAGSCNVTQIFRGQDGAMEMTSCQTPAARAGAGEAPPEPPPCAGVTEAFAAAARDRTDTHPLKMSLPFSSSANQSPNVKKDFPATQSDNSVLKRASNQHLIVQQDTQLCTEKNPVNVEDRRDPPVLRTVKQEARTISAIPGSIYSETVFRADRTVVFSTCDEMEITGNYTDVIYSDSTKELNSSCHKAFEKAVNTSSSQAETRRPTHGDRDVTRSLPSLDNRASVSYKSTALELALGSDERIERVTQEPRTASGNAGFDSRTNSVSTDVSKGGVQHRPANSQRVSLPGEKTVIFSEDMDLTKAWLVKDNGKNAENESAGMFTSVTCKPHFLGDRSTCPTSNEPEEMEVTKCHAVVIDDQSNRMTAEAKPVHCQIISRKNQNKNISESARSLDMDKENLEVTSIGGNVKRNQAIEMTTTDLERIMVDKKLAKTSSQASGPSSCAKSVWSLPEQRRRVPENSVTDTSAVVSLQSQKVVVSQPLGKSLLNASVSCTNDKTCEFSDDENMDITKTHPAALDVAPIHIAQECENNHNQNNVISEQLQHQTLLFARSSGADITGQTTAMERGDLKTSTNKQAVTPLAPRGSFISSSEPAPSGTRGNEPPGTLLGINADCPIPARQEKTHPTKAATKGLATRVGSEGDLGNPPPAAGLRPAGSEELFLARTAEPQRGRAQLPSFLEKSVVFPSGENMDLTGNCAVMAPDLNTNPVVSERKAVPGYLVEEENKTMSLKKGVMMTINPQEQSNGYSLVSGQKMLTMTGLEQVPFAGEQTTIFSEDADMDITRSHQVSAGNKMILQSKSLTDEMSLVSGDKTCVFTCNNDMEISRLDTTATDKSTERAASQGMLNVAKRPARKSLKGATGEKTVVFSLSDDNNDMEITASHTAAIGHEIVSQNEGGCHPASSAHPAQTLLFTSSQADMDITRSCSADKITIKVVCDAKPDSGKEAGQQAPSNSEVTVFAVDDMEITKAHNVALEENPLQSQQLSQVAPVAASGTFTPYQADADTTESRPVERVLCEDRLNLAQQVGQEAAAESKTILFALAEDMDITKTHTALVRGKVGGQDGGPADKTIVFPHNQDDMEITASHTAAVNDGFENQDVPHTSTQQPDPHRALSSCRDEVDSLHMKDPNGEYQTKCQDKPGVPSPALSATAFPSGKGAVEVPSGTPPDPICSVSRAGETVAVPAPQDVPLPTDDRVPGSGQQRLAPPENPKSQRVPLQLPSSGPVGCSEESGEVVSCVLPPVQQPGSPAACSTQRNQVLKVDSAGQEGLGPDLGLAATNLVWVSNTESKENEGLSAEGGTPPKDFQINSDHNEQLQVSDSPGDQIDPTLAPKRSGIFNICSKLENIRRKSAVLSVSETACSDQLPRSSAQPEDTLRLGKNTGNDPNNSFPTKEQQDARLESGAAPVGANLGMALKDKYQGLSVPLGVFQPKLPNRRNPSVSSVQDVNAKPSDKGEAPVSEISGNAGETPGNQKPSRQICSPSQFIAEELLPVFPEEMDSNESVSSEFVENACTEISKNQNSHNEKNQIEESKTCNNTKRAAERDEEDVQSPKKLRRDEPLAGEASRDVQVTFGAVSQSRVDEVDEGDDPAKMSVKSLECTQASSSSSSSLDWARAEAELTSQRSSQMEPQLLTDSICEDTLWEKFQNGDITVREFFTLVQVHVPIQKPRHSHLPATCAVPAPPSAEDLLYSQYVHRPKLRIYEEDCQALLQMIDELKPWVDVQDQLLVNVNKSLWEVMRSCSDEELKSFGAELNKMKSCFTKESKILAHKEKAALYSKLLQSAQDQYGELQSRAERMDELIQEAQSCLLALGADSDREEQETDCSDEMPQVKNLEEELESLKAEEEELQRELAELETENEQMLVQMNQLQEQEKSFRELLEKYDFTEWEITEWSEQRAVFSFLYDSIELTVVFGPPIDGDVFGEDPSRRIVSLTFESLLDEERAPPSSCLVQRLIFQFIRSQGCWQEQCPTLRCLPQVLREVSLVVSHCKTLGEEIEFLQRWGGKFNLLKTDVNDTEVKLLFSTSAAFAKFELTLSLSAGYPSAALPFTVRKQIGNIGEEEISAVLSSVPSGYHYLRRIVSLIHQNLLQAPS